MDSALLDIEMRNGSIQLAVRVFADRPAPENGMRRLLIFYCLI